MRSARRRGGDPRRFSEIEDSGLLPVEMTHYGPLFRRLIHELRSEEAARAFSEKFGVNLVGRRRCSPCATLRRQRRPHPHRHVDQADHGADLLQRGLGGEGGRLRLLRSATDSNDMICEAPPDLGAMIRSAASDCSFHGHDRSRRAALRDGQLDDQRFRRPARIVPHRVSARAKQALKLIRRAARQCGGARG